MYHTWFHGGFLSHHAHQPEMIRSSICIADFHPSTASSHNHHLKLHQIASHHIWLPWFFLELVYQLLLLFCSFNLALLGQWASSWALLLAQAFRPDLGERQS